MSVSSVLVLMCSHVRTWAQTHPSQLWHDPPPILAQGWARGRWRSQRTCLSITRYLLGKISNNGHPQILNPIGTNMEWRRSPLSVQTVQTSRAHHLLLCLLASHWQTLHIKSASYSPPPSVPQVCQARALIPAHIKQRGKTGRVSVYLSMSSSPVGAQIPQSLKISLQLVLQVGIELQLGHL